MFMASTHEVPVEFIPFPLVLSIKSAFEHPVMDGGRAHRNWESWVPSSVPGDKRGNKQINEPLPASPALLAEDCCGWDNGLTSPQSCMVPAAVGSDAHSQGDDGSSPLKQDGRQEILQGTTNLCKRHRKL